MSDAITNWNDLGDDDKAKIAIQIYTPAFTRQFAGARDMHAKVEVTVGHRAANIDVKISEVIHCLWGAGMETIGCCEKGLYLAIENTQTAWIRFLSAEHGADRFVQALESEGVPVSVMPSTGVHRFNLGVPTQQVMMRMPIVHFLPQNIDRVLVSIAGVA